MSDSMEMKENGAYDKGSERMDGPSQHSQDGPREIGKRQKTGGQKCAGCLKSNLLVIFLIIGMACGIAMGFGLRAYKLTKREQMYLAFPGDLLMRMLRMCIIPLIVSSMITGMAGLPSTAAGKMGLRAVLYYMITTVIAVILGIILVLSIRPGYRTGTLTDSTNRERVVNGVDSIMDLIRNAFPKNLITACFSQARTQYKPLPPIVTVPEGNWTANWTTMAIPTTTMGVITTINGTAAPTTAPKIEYDFYLTEDGGGTNILGIVVFCIVFGIIVGRQGHSSLVLRQFFLAFHNAIIVLVKLIIWYSPVGVAFLVASRIVGMKDPALTFMSLAWYAATVLAGLIIHGFIILPAIYLIFARRNPFKLMGHVSQALFTALGTASSSATLPVTMQCLIEKAKVDKRIAQFILPVGATINMDGTALYEAVASIYIAQINGIDLNIGQVITVSITATAAAIGAAGIPEAGLITMTIVLTAVGLPIEDIGLLYAIDWFLDRCRTSINVWGDSVGAGVVEAMSKSDLEKFPEHEDDILMDRVVHVDDGNVDHKNRY